MKTMQEKVLLDVRNFSKHTEMLELVESREPKKKKNTKSELGDTLKHFKTNRTKTGEESKVSLLCFSNYVNFE